MELSKRILKNGDKLRYISFTIAECEDFNIHVGDKLILTIDGVQLPKRTARMQSVIRVYIPAKFIKRFKAGQRYQVKVRHV